MFKNLSDRLQNSFDKIKGQARLTEDNIKTALRDVRMALLEADVALEVVKIFISNIEQQAMGEKVLNSLTPSQTFISLVQNSLEKALGEKNETLNLKSQPPTVILMAGLQGAGKTTSTAKLAKFLTEQQKKRVMVVSTDIYRPAAIKQLEILANDLKISFFESNQSQNPLDIAKNALKEAKQQVMDVLIVDTAGRLHIDEDMMSEIKMIHAAVSPTETLFTVDSMTGQDAAITAKAFDESLPLTGIILTKADGDSRGGAALSIRQVTGKPIKFIGTGEKADALEPFYPERIASRILGMGDILSLIDQVKQKTDKESSDKIAKKIKSGKNFTLTDFKNQLIQMKKMGGASAMIDKLPGGSRLANNMPAQIDDSLFIKMEAMINSMTLFERRKPEFIKSSRKLRIAAGSGTKVQDINKMLKQFDQMKKMMKKMSQKGGIGKLMGAMRGMKGMQQMPPNQRR